MDPHSSGDSGNWGFLKPRFWEIFPNALVLWPLVMIHLNKFNLKLFFFTALWIPLYHQLLMLLCYVPYCLPFPPGSSISSRHNKRHNSITQDGETEIKFTLLPGTTNTWIQYMTWCFVGHWTSDNEVQWSLGNRRQHESYDCSSLLSGEFPVHRVGKWGLAAESDSLSWGAGFDSLWKPKQLELIEQSTGKERTSHREKTRELHIVPLQHSTEYWYT